MASLLTDADYAQQFVNFVQLQARLARGDDAPPATLEAWQSQRAKLRERLINSWGGFPRERCALEPRIVGELQRPGYRVEKILLQTRPGIQMTANAYVPEGAGKRAAVLCVHGHWKGAKQDPTVQSRCIGLAKLGFFVLVVDAFGAGERGIRKELGEYHGEMTAGTLWPTGLALAGLQAWDNIRAIDYLQSRTEVDPERLGVTGASGGGNQSMYIGAIDERLQAVVPTCSVGTYQAYLGAACCMCEVTPAALSYTEESGVLSLVAPRALMLISATRDAFQFSVGEAAKSLTTATDVFRLYGAKTKAKHAIFESGHDYSRPMREAMYGWMALHLRGEGNGSPIPEPEFTTEEPETLRCFPGDTRPEDFVTLPRFAAAEGARINATRPLPSHLEHWQTQESSICGGLSHCLGEFPERTPLNLLSEQGEGLVRLQYDSEPGIQIPAELRLGGTAVDRLAILLDLDNGRRAADADLASKLLNQGCRLVTVDLRGTAALAHTRDAIGKAPDHNTAEWSMWLGRPLLGQWVWDTVRLLDAVERQQRRAFSDVALIGVGPAGLVALAAAALSTRFTRIAIHKTLATFVSPVPFQGQRLGTLVPGILRDAGDVPHLAATLSPRRLIISHPVRGDAEPVADMALQELFGITHRAYGLERVAKELHVLPQATEDEIVTALWQQS